jgi:hypothetical protein
MIRHKQARSGQRTYLLAIGLIVSSIVPTTACTPFDGPRPEPAGIYDLVSVDSRPLPHTGTSKDGTRTVTGGSLSLAAGFGKGGTLLTQFADQSEPSAVDVQWFSHDGRIDLTFEADGVWYSHPDCRWNEERVVVTFSAAEPMPAGTYVYWKRAG